MKQRYNVERDFIASVNMSSAFQHISLVCPESFICSLSVRMYGKNIVSALA